MTSTGSTSSTSSSLSSDSSLAGTSRTWQDALHVLDDPAPVFEQLRRQVVAAVEDGRARPGDRLPTVRGLAERLQLAPGTVAKAYRHLEAEGVVVTKTRAGTVIADSRVGVDHRLREAVAGAVAAAATAGLTEDELVTTVRAAFRSAAAAAPTGASPTG